ncbi:hypothetical protein GGI17_006708, partial [Coemansia sp. S146]
MKGDYEHYVKHALTVDEFTPTLEELGTTRSRDVIATSREYIAPVREDHDKLKAGEITFEEAQHKKEELLKQLIKQQDSKRQRERRQSGVHVKKQVERDVSKMTTKATDSISMSIDEFKQGVPVVYKEVALIVPAQKEIERVVEVTRIMKFKDFEMFTANDLSTNCLRQVVEHFGETWNPSKTLEEMLVPRKVIKGHPGHKEMHQIDNYGDLVWDYHEDVATTDCTNIARIVDYNGHVGVVTYIKRKPSPLKIMKRLPYKSSIDNTISIFVDIEAFESPQPGKYKLQVPYLICWSVFDGGAADTSDPCKPGSENCSSLRNSLPHHESIADSGSDSLPVGYLLPPEVAEEEEDD